MVLTRSGRSSVGGIVSEDTYTTRKSAKTAIITKSDQPHLDQDEQEPIIRYATRPENVFFVYWNPLHDYLWNNNETKSTSFLKIVQQAEFKPGFISKWILFPLFFGYLLFNIGYGVKQSLEHAPIHMFEYGFFRSALEFGTQPQISLVLHSVFGGIFICSCLFQTSFATKLLTAPNYRRYHRIIGKMCLFCSMIASSNGIVLSFKALHGTALIYLLGTSLWFLFSIMTLVRGLQRDIAAHHRWALALQQVGLMFITSRMIYPVCLMAKFNEQQCYFVGVWGAGALAYAWFYLQIQNTRKALQTIMETNHYQNQQFSVTDSVRVIQSWFLRLFFVFVFVSSVIFFVNNDQISRTLALQVEATFLLLVILGSLINIFVSPQRKIQ